MRRRLCVPMMTLCLLLTGCAPSRREAVQAYYKSIRTAQMEAQVVVHLSSDDRTFSVTAAYDREKGATTTIVEPELLQGLSATVSQEDMHLLYDGSVWPAGDGGDLSAAHCLPMPLYAAGGAGRGRRGPVGGHLLAHAAVRGRGGVRDPGGKRPHRRPGVHISDHRGIRQRWRGIHLHPMGAAGDLCTLCIRAEPEWKGAADRDIYAVYL